MKKDYTEVLMILDESGSMGTIKEETIVTVNNFIAGQKKIPGEMKMTLITFNSENTVVWESKDIKDVLELKKTDYCPDKYTALYDAVYTGVADLGEKLSKMKEENRPEKVIVVIITDGEENASTRFNLGAVLDAIKTQQEVYNWQFLFLGANIDAHKVGTSMGVSSAYCCNFKSSSSGVSNAGSYANHVVGNARKGVTYRTYENADDYANDQKNKNPIDPTSKGGSK